MNPYKPAELRSLIQTSLNGLGLYSAEAEELLIATAAQESHLGEYRRQINGPALGIFQMEPGDHDDIWVNFLHYHSKLGDQLHCHQAHGLAGLLFDDIYATQMARIHYMRCPKALPSATSLNDIWMYYKVNYNSLNGAAKEYDFVRNYHTYVTDGKAT